MTAGTGSATAPRAATLELRSVEKRYAGQREPAISSLTLKVPAGEVCVLVGPSGSGKTTAMRLINRMIPLTGGDILIGERSILATPATELRRQIGYVIQQVGLFPHHTVNDNVGTVPRLLGWDRRRTSARVQELLELVNLDPAELGGRYPHELSGGQRQRVGVARALAADPPLMLMDEPFGAIDPINRARLQDEFLRLQARVRKTVVFVTHDIDEAIKMGDRIAVLREGGKLAQYATPGELLTDPADEFVAGFVGADRALKRLGLITLAEIDLAAPGGVATSETRMPLTSTARDALAAMLAAGGSAVTVVDERGAVVGVATLDLIGRVFSAADSAPGAGEDGRGRPDRAAGGVR